MGWTPCRPQTNEDGDRPHQNPTPKTCRREALWSAVRQLTDCRFRVSSWLEPVAVARSPHGTVNRMGEQGNADRAGGGSALQRGSPSTDGPHSKARMEEDRSCGLWGIILKAGGVVLWGGEICVRGKR
jgi:hypothetical protein